MAKKKLNKEQQRLLELAGMGMGRHRYRGYEDEEDMNMRPDEDMAGDDMNGDMNGEERDEMDMNGGEGSSLDDILAQAQGLEADELLDLVQQLTQLAQGKMGGSAEDDMNGDEMNGNGGEETSQAYQKMQRDEKY